MKKNRLSNILTSLVLTFVLSLSLFLTIPLHAHAEDENQQTTTAVPEDAVDCQMGESSFYVSPYNEFYPLNSTISVEFVLNSEEEIESFDVEYENLTVINSTENAAEKKVTVSFTCDSSSEFSTLYVSATLSSGLELVRNLHVFNNEVGHYMSGTSKDTARDLYLRSLVNSGKLSEDEYYSLKNELYSQNVIQSFTVTPGTANIDSQISTMATASADTNVMVTLLWADDSGVNHALRKVKVELWDEEPNNKEQLLATGYTTNEGICVISFENADGFFQFENGGYDIFLRIYAGDDNVMVKNYSTGEAYHLKTDVYENVDTGNTYNYSAIFSMSDDLGNAMQISQSLITAQTYAKDMIGSNPPSLTLYYPYVKPDKDSHPYFYSSSNSSIYIQKTTNTNDEPNSYASWDMIMHEYGHHIQHYCGIIDNTGCDKEHQIHLDMGYEYLSKDLGMRSAWNESWPTVFAHIAQQYSSSYIDSIPYVNDLSNDCINTHVFSVESMTGRGECNEASIVTTLWDLFDAGYNEDFDTLVLWYGGFWNSTTANGHKSFHQYISTLYNMYPNNIFEIGAILTHNKLAVDIRDEYSTIDEEDQYIEYTVPGGGTLYRLNLIELLIYNENEELILTITLDASKTSYKLSSDQWLTILTNCDGFFLACISAYQTDAPTTGCYYSERVCFIID